MKLHRRAEMIRAMETIARSINDEGIFESWLMCGVADGDIDGNESDEDLEFYCKDEDFADIMGLFLRLMTRANNNGGLYEDGIVSKHMGY